MRWLVVLVAVGSGCYSPQLAPCTVRCADRTACPDELTCGADLYCHDAGDAAACPVNLDLTIDGNGAGRVESDPPGVDCTSSSSGTGCDEIPFAVGTTITLSESHSSGNQFGGWSGDACVGSTARTCAFTITTAMTINARFD